jgi:peptidoglycan/LPS O-acetylase OafA/YrhL
MSYVEKYKPSLSEMTWVMITGTLLLILMAYLVLKYIDEPIRRGLRNRRAAAKVLVNVTK